MSIHVSPPYRRVARPSAEVPVVLPQINIIVDEHGSLNVRVDGEPYRPDEKFQRADLERIVTSIAAALGSAVRVDVRENDGTVFTDIITPPATPRVGVAQAPASASSTGELIQAGFGPQQRVAIAVIVAHQAADESGTVRLHLPPSLLATYGGRIVVLPETAHAAQGAA